MLPRILLVPFLLAFACAAPPLPRQEPIPVSPLRVGTDEWRVTDQLVLVTDASGTMYAEKTFPQAKALTESFVASLPDASARAKAPGRYRAGLIGFGGKDRTVEPLGDFDRAGLARTANALEIMGAVDGRGGETPLHRVLEEVGASLEPEGRAAVVVFSDGLADAPDAALAVGAILVEEQGGELCFHTVQTGDNPEGRMFMEQLAALTPCGSFTPAAQLQDAAAIQRLARGVLLAGAPRQRAAPAPAPRGPDPCQERVSFGGVNFDFDKATIRDDARPVLRQWGERLAQCDNVNLTIEGHTDSIGPEAYNQVLSERRGNSVRDFLVSRGVPRSRLSVTGYGETRPIASNATAEGRAKNRRVDIVPVQ